MRTQTVLLASLLVVLSGCQPETPVQQAPAAEPSVSVAPVVMVPASAPAPAVESAPVAEPAPPVTEKPTATVATKPVAVPAPASVTSPLSAKVVEPVAAKPVEPTAAKAEVIAAPSEADGLALAKKNNCLACHAIDRKVVGPAWKDVAAKYRGDAGAEARMMDKIAKGSKGAWGSMAMPASPNVSEADRRALARFVLSLK